MQNSDPDVDKNQKINILKIKDIAKLGAIAIIEVNMGTLYRRTAYSICNLKDDVPKEIIIIFYSGSNYNYHFTIKELTEEFEIQFTFQEKILKNA